MKRLATSAAVLAILAMAWGHPAHALDVDPSTSDGPEAASTESENTPGPPAPAVETGSVEDATTGPAGESKPMSPVGAALRKVLEAEAAAMPPEPPLAEGEKRPPKPPEQRDREAIDAFYASRNNDPVWIADGKLTPKAEALVAEVKRVGDWGIDTNVFELPKLGSAPSERDLADAELALSRLVLVYHRFARGGAIYDAPNQLTSYLDRRPQLRDRKKTLEDAVASSDISAYLVAMHPQQPEFQRLHKAWLEAKANPRAKGKANAEQLLANMEMWRLLPEDLGKFYVWLNVPEYTVRIIKDGETVFTERVTVGLVNKQTPIFSDEMVRVTFRSRWRVPDSIKVREVWPSLLKGGGMMRQHGLIMTREGSDEPIDWRKVDWSKADMNDYVLWQPPGPKNQLGVVKFSFPNKHYVFMHDTPDKYMFAWTRRANSHGCMRIRNPLQMAAIILGKDKGWDRAKIDELATNGPEHNIIELDEKIPVHITYLTARIGDDGKLQTFADIYGHEKRVRQALAGQWQAIAKLPDHLAPLDQTRVPRVTTTANRGRALPQEKSLTEMLFGSFN